MKCSVIYRLCSIGSNFRRIVRLDASFYPLRKFNSEFPNREDKYEELRIKMASVPSSNLLNEGLKTFRQDLCSDNDDRLEEVQNWCKKVFEYNSSAILLDYATLLKAYCTFGFDLTDENWNNWESDGWKSAVKLTWCLDTLSSAYIILDDIVDKSITRRGKLCWYKKVGLSAINDFSMIQGKVFQLLIKYFAASKCYLNIMNEFLENGGYTKEEYDFTKKICLKLGMYAQMLNDRYDYTCPLEYSGLKGNDIRIRKLTWFSAKFFEEAIDSKKKVFMENYGVDDDDAVNNIMELYKKTNLLERFEEFERNIFREIKILIESKSYIKGALFYEILNQLKIRKELLNIK